MKFGAASWPFQWDPPYEEAIRRIASLEFKAVELIAWDEDFLERYYTPAKIRELKEVLAGEGVELSQFVYTPFDLSHPDKAKRREAVEAFRKAVTVGAELGSAIINSVGALPFGMRFGQEFPWLTQKPLVQTFSARMPRGLDWDENYHHYVEAVRACADACEQAGVVYSVEPHPYTYAANTSGCLRLIERVGSAALGINFDPSHTFPVGDFPNVSVYQLGEHIKHIHVSDNDAVTNVHWRPGQGKIDWVAMFQALKDVGYGGVVSIELEDVPGVSRGGADAPGVYRNKTATDAFVAENLAGIRYLRGVCEEVGIDAT